MPIPSTPSIMPNVLGYAADTVQIPETTPTGQGIPSFRDLFPFITQVAPDAGGVMVERAWMNALFNLLGQHTFFQQSGCVYPWQATLNYISGSHVKGSDDVEYIALQPSGPDVSGTGVKDPTQENNRAYWISLSSFVNLKSVPQTRTVTTLSPLFGGGDLSEDRVFSIAKATLSEMGAIQLASQQEAKEGIDEFKAITPLTLKAVFTQSLLDQGGWQQLPSGLIFQWGKVACADRANTNVLFPVSFPTGCLHLVGTGMNVAGNTQAYVTVNSYDKSGGIFNCFYAVSGQVPVLAAKDNVQVWYIAIGI